MYVSQNEIEKCLQKAKEITEYFLLEHIGADDPQRSIDNLLITVRKRVSTPITVEVLEFEKSEVVEWGATFFWKDRVDIRIISDLNFCWQRFVLCKELFHVLIDTESYQDPDMLQHLSNILLAFPDEESKPGQAVQVEFFAEVAAMEFLFPYAARVRELQGESKGNFLDIAKKYRVPQVLVEKYMSPGYMENLKAFHATEL